MPTLLCQLMNEMWANETHAIGMHEPVVAMMTTTTTDNNFKKNKNNNAAAATADDDATFKTIVTRAFRVVIVIENTLGAYFVFIISFVCK